MAADEKDRFIQYLVDKVNMYELDRRATELAVEEFQSTFDSVSASLESLKKDMEAVKSELREERSKRKKAETKARKLDRQLKYAQKNKFGSESDVCPKWSAYMWKKTTTETLLSKP